MNDPLDIAGLLATKDARIKQLEAEVGRKKAVIEYLNNKIMELEATAERYCHNIDRLAQQIGDMSRHPLHRRSIMEGVKG